METSFSRRFSVLFIERRGTMREEEECWLSPTLPSG
jgi:hypothetical protein